jgi:hypothetical protein
MSDPSTKFPSFEPDYLGDGVYARFDGYYIRLSVNDHRAEPVIAIEAPVLRALIEYAKRVGM